MGRASVVLELLKKEVDICKLQADIGKQVEEKISKDQRRYFLQARPPSILLPPGPAPAPGDTTTYTVGSIGGLLNCSLPSAQRLAQLPVATSAGSYHTRAALHRGQRPLRLDRGAGANVPHTNRGSI